MQIFVLGMHRSGTSAVARILNLMGAYFGGEHVGTGRSGENLKGFWERRDVRELNDHMLFDSRCDWDCITNFDLDAVPGETRSAYVDAAADIVLNMDAHRPWFIKEPRLCLLFPIWRQTLENPFCIHVLRNPLEIAHSLKARNKIPIRAGLALWEIYSLRALNASAGLHRVFVSYEDLMKNASAVVEMLESVLVEQGAHGLRIPSGVELNRFLDDALYRHRKSDRSLRSVATAYQLELYEILCGDNQALEAYSPPAPSDSAIEILRHHERSVDVDGRITLANRARRRRVPEGASTQLKLKDLELEHSRSLMRQASQRLGEVEQENRRLRQADVEIRTALARSAQKAEDLASEFDNVRKMTASLEEERTALRDLNADLEMRRAILQQANASLEDDLAGLRDERSVLAKAKDELEAAQIVAGKERAALQERIGVLTGESADLAETNAALREDLAVRTRDSEALAEANAALREGNKELARERTLLERAGADLELARASLEQSNAALNQEHGDLRLERTLLQEANVELEEKSAVLEQIRARAESDRDALATRFGRAGDEVAARQSRVRDAVLLWDRELGHRKDAASALALLASALHSDIAGLLGSRRWRLGRAIVSGLYILSFRGVPKDVGVRLSMASTAHEANMQLIVDFATSRDDIPRKLVDLLPAATAIDELLDHLPLRSAELTARLLERGLELKRRAQQIEALSAHIDSLVSIFEGIVGSWRWHLGNAVISTLYRLLRGKVPATAVDSAATLVARYRLGSYADVTTRPVIPVPPVQAEETRGDGAGATPSEPPNNTDGRAPDAAAGRSGSQARRSKRTALVPTPLDRTGPSKGMVELAPKARPTVRPSLPDTRVDIVVCVHDALEDAKRCLESVMSRTAIDFRLIVVNDGSDPETTTWLRQLSDRHSVIELIETDGPLGYTRAANRGLRSSTAPYVALLNSDTIMPRLWVESLLECLRADDQIGIVGPLSNAASWQSIPERFAQGGGWAVNGIPTGYNVDEYSELVHQLSERAFPRVEFLNGFCLLMQREVIEAIEYLDEEAFPRGYGEENDYCIRAREAGFQLAIADHCFVYHAKSRSFGEETRDRLAEEGRKALWHKHGREVIEGGTERLKADPDLARVRSKVSSFVALAPRGGIGGPLPRRAPGSCHIDMRILFVLPVRGGSGGANSVVQEVAGMRSVGVNASIAVDARHAESMHRFYADILEPGSRIVFASDEELLTIAERFDVVVATLWSTPRLIAPIAERWPEKAYVYYVQDYEPWFFPNDPESRNVALDSYTRVPNMALMAKTDWICRTVRERHDVEVFRVAPSLDHDVFYPARRPHERPVSLCAMIRPATPRRAPLRTLRVLRDLALRLDGLRIVLFGCENDALEDLVRHEPGLELDFVFENRGILTRRDVADLLRESDIFLDLSDYQAFGRSGLEAMACGCATVLPARGGADEYAVDGENAFLVDTTSFEEMTSTVTRLVIDQSLRQRFKERSLATAARYSIVRASLSELSVFRWTWTVGRDNGFHGDVYRRGIEPLNM